MAGAVLIMAGGTGGHIFPGLAVAEALRQMQVAVCWLGAPRGLENQLVPAAGIELLQIQVSALRGRGVGGWLSAPLRLLRAFWQARCVLKRLQPRCVLSMGGYAAGPGGLAARWLGIPLVVHEQNRRPGLTNRWLARWAQQVCEAFPASFAPHFYARVTGNPVRAAIAAVAAPAERLAARQGKLRVLVLGGSLGARFLNLEVPQVIAQIAPEQQPEVWHQCGQRGLEETQAAYAEHAISARIEPFISDMAAAYAWADVVICRAGALTLSELMAVGSAAILVPFPHAVDDHQYANAQVLSTAGAALTVREADWDRAAISAQLQQWRQQRAPLLAMAQAARALYTAEAAQTVARICLEVAR